MAHVNWGFLMDESDIHASVKFLFDEAFVKEKGGFDEVSLCGWKSLTVLLPREEKGETGWRPHFDRITGDGNVMSLHEAVVEVTENDTAIVIQAELPGVKMDSIYIEVKGNILTLKGEQVMHTGHQGEDNYLDERCYASFHRAFTLPEVVRPGDVWARCTGDVVRIEIRKRMRASIR